MSAFVSVPSVGSVDSTSSDNTLLVTVEELLTSICVGKAVALRYKLLSHGRPGSTETCSVVGCLLVDAVQTSLPRMSRCVCHVSGFVAPPVFGFASSHCCILPAKTGCENVLISFLDDHVFFSPLYVRLSCHRATLASVIEEQVGVACSKVYHIGCWN